MAASQAKCTCSAADLIWNAAKQPSPAAEQVLNSLRNPGPRTVASGVRVVVTRFPQTSWAGCEARRGFQQIDRRRSQLLCGLALGGAPMHGPARHRRFAQPGKGRVCFGPLFNRATSHPWSPWSPADRLDSARIVPRQGDGFRRYRIPVPDVEQDAHKAVVVATSPG